MIKINARLLQRILKDIDLHPQLMAKEFSQSTKISTQACPVDKQTYGRPSLPA